MSNREAKDFDGSRRRGSVSKSGFVWGSRMQVDHVKAGTKIYNPTHEESTANSNRSGSSSMKNAGVEVDKKVNKMRPKQSPVGVSGKGKTLKSESSEGSPVKISDLGKNLDEQSCVSSDGMRKSPLQIKKTTDVKLRKVKSDFTESLNDMKIEGKSELRKVKSELGGNLKDSLSLQLVKAKTEVEKKSIDDEKVADEEDLEGLVCIEKSRSDEDCKEFGLDNVGENQIMKSQPNVDSVDNEEGDDKEMEVEVEKKILDIKEMNTSVEEEKTEELVIEEKKLIQCNEKPVPDSSMVKKQAVNHGRIHPNLRTRKPISDHFHENPSSQSKLRNFVDLVMWRDVSKSAFIFGIGSFAIISSSYTKDLNISFISVLSYLSLIYLAVNFLLKSLITRGAMDEDNRKQDYVVGEEEAVWVIKLILPSVNEFLLKLRDLFSGDPATTLKLAVLLFVLARCGGSITLWKMTKLGFFGVFTVPKVCSSYSSQLNAYGTFWIRRFGDAWESCSHKKAVGFGIFTLVWNMSSVVARIWAVFILFVAFKYYQQFYFKEERIQENATTGNSNSQYIGGRQKNARSTIIDAKKQKKVC